MTEADAMVRWCPFAASRSVTAWYSERESTFTVNYIGPGDHDKATPLCLASSCMAWRWDADFNELMAKHPDKSGSEIRGLADGHCGLAG